MKKGLRRLIAAVLALGVAGGVGFGGYRVYQNYHGGAVEVYAMDNLTTTYWGDETQTEGIVSTDKLQSEYLSDTQTVEKVLIKEGQRVKKGDVLFTYDSTLTDLDLKRKDLALQQKQLELENARKQLNVIRTYKAGKPIPGSGGGGGSSYSKPSKPAKPEKPTYPGLFLVEGTGTDKSPYAYIWKDDFLFTDELLAAAMQGKDEAYVRFYVTGDTYEPPVIHVDTNGNADPNRPDIPKDLYSSWTMQCQHTNTGYRYVMTSMNIGGPDGFERTVSAPLPALTEDEKPVSEDDLWSDWGGTDGGFSGIVYTSAEIAAMLREAEESIKSLDMEYRQLQLEAKKLQREADNSAVYSELDGIVSLLNDPNELESGTPLLKVSGGGGYIIKGTISELDLESVTPGQSVNINYWMTGENYSGTIESISDYPTQSSGYWGEGNNNVSFYSFSVRVDESANLQENDYVEMSYTAGNNGGGQNIYLMKSFVRSEDGKSYVYADKNGTLEKRYVSTGRDLWGSYVEIRSDLSDVTHLAFPYGQKVRENAPTVEGSMESLYNY